MQNPKELIEKNLSVYLEGKDIKLKFDVSLTQNPLFGDFTTNIALILSKEIEGENPRLTADKIIVFLKENNELKEMFEDIKPAGPGFINFYLNKDYLAKTLTEVVQQGEAYGKSNNNSRQRVMVEFGDPNPFKEIHIGHLRNFCIGESFSRLLETQGNEVLRANYQGDVGMHVAKCLWGILQKTEDRRQETGLTVGDLAEGYVLGAKMFEEDEAAKQEIVELNKKVYNEDSEIKPLWEEGRKVSLEHFEELYKRAGVHYDKYYFESVTAKKGKELVLSHIEDGIFERHEGAVVYRGEQDGLHTRVFLTSQDYATYEGKDLALAIIKNDDVKYDQSIVLTGNEQLEYFAVMLSALKKISPELTEKTKHFAFGHVRVREGKMSSRTGDVITAIWLLDEAIKRVGQAFSDMDQETLEKVGVGAVKYSMLKFSIPSDIHFDFEESISIEGNSGPYLQYTYVRTQSVIQKAEDRSREAELHTTPRGQAMLTNDKMQTEENELLRFLAQYPYCVKMAATTFSPNLLCNYLFELSQKYNLFYQKCRVIGSENESFRLSLTKGVGIVLQNGLTLLGIETVSKM